jgi:hypothetical protein
VSVIADAMALTSGVRRVTDAVLKMVKLDLAALEDAYRA